MNWAIPRAAVDLFIVAYLFLACFWSLRGAPALRRLWRPLERAVLWSGLWHDWNMFAPNPLHSNALLSAEVALDSGRIETWKQPDFGAMGLFEALARERERKFFEQVASGEFAALRPEVAAFIARSYRRKGFRPVTVRLVQISREIPPPGEPTAPLRREALGAFDVGETPP